MRASYAAQPGVIDFAGARANAYKPKEAGRKPPDIKWGDPPPALPKGAKFAVLYGDPGKAGPYVIRLMLPVGYKVAPHWHTLPENLTVISGTFYLATGDMMDKAHAHPLKEGGFHYLPAQAHHSAYAGSKTILQVHGEGPFDITYINPADDPSKAKK